MCQTEFLTSAVVTIGFNTVNHSVLEDAGSVNVTVSILNGTLARNVVITLLPLSGGTATGKLNKLSSCTLIKKTHQYKYSSHLSSWDRLH